MTIHPILKASMVSVHVAGYETKSTPLKKRHRRTILSPWKFCLFCRFGRGGLHRTSLIWHFFKGDFTGCLLLFLFASATCFCFVGILQGQTGECWLNGGFFLVPFQGFPRMTGLSNNSSYFSQSYISLKGPFEVT